jgi:cob(I)alamin adenosyltransferase
MKKKEKGLIVVFTGQGKGKTTAALGVALRASGHDMNTLMIEFMKEEGKSGEQKVCPAMLKKIEIYPFGMGFVFRGDDPRPHMEIVENAWLFMEEMLLNKKYQILILDEISVALNLGLFPIDRVINFLILKDDTLHVIITGRDAPPELIKMADIVTEMKEVKHIFREGASATLGLDY